MRPLTLLFVLFSFSCLAQLPRPVVLRITAEDLKKRDHLNPHKVRLRRLPEDTAVFFTLLVKNTTQDTLTKLKLEDCHFFARTKGFDKPLAPGDTLTLFLAEHPHQRMKENTHRESYIRITAWSRGKPLPYYDVELQYAITRMQRDHGHHWSRENPGVRWGELKPDSVVTNLDTLYRGQHVRIVTHFQNTGTNTLRIDDAFSLWPENIKAKAVYFPKTVERGMRDSIVYEGDVVSTGGADTLRYKGHYSVDANQFPQQFVEVPVHAVIIDSTLRRFRVYYDAFAYRDGFWYSEKKFYYSTDPKQKRDILLKQPVPFQQGRMQVYFRNGISSMSSFSSRADSIVVFDDHFRRLSRIIEHAHRHTSSVFDTTGLLTTMASSREKFSLDLLKERDQTRSGKSVLRLKIRGDWTTARSEHIDYREGKRFYRKVETRHGNCQKEWFYQTNTIVRTVQQPLFRRTKIITWKNGGRTVSYRPFRRPGPKYPGPHRGSKHHGSKRFDPMR